jgi:hypothetical protein
VLLSACSPIRHRNKQTTETDKAAVNDVCTFIMRMKLNTRSFQQRVDWKNPSSRVRTVSDQASRAAAAFAARKGSKQQQRSSTGIGRDSSVSLPGLAVEWNLEAGSSWVWNDNQEGAAKSDSKLLTRLLQQAKLTTHPTSQTI